MNLRTTTLPAIGLISALLLAGCAQTSGGSTDDMDGMDHNSASTPAEETTGEFNDSDVMFARMMIPHHQQAVEMSDVLLAKDGVTPEVAALAEEIKDAQQPEIDLMTEWLTVWGEPAETGGMDHSADGGMMSEGDMTALEDASGQDASTLFLEQMIRHHEGAIAMAEAEAANGENSDAVALAEQIIKTQTAEIERMQQLLTS